MALKTISPDKAQALVSAGARLVDIRGADEFRRSHVPGAHNRPLDGLTEGAFDQPVVFMCKTGMRTGSNVTRLETACIDDAYILEGGLDNWRNSGLAVAEDSSQPLEIMRQVQITAGLLILLGIGLGTILAPVWYGLSAFVGAGLLFAGATGWCGMANLLSLMPWNRSRPA